MNDFLQSLRNGTIKRQDRNRKHFDKPQSQYKNAERGGNRDKRNNNPHKSFGAPDLGDLKKLLQSMNDNAELTRIAQERAAEALERIARTLQSMTQSAEDLPEPAPTMAAPLETQPAPEPEMPAETIAAAPSDAPEQIEESVEAADLRTGTVAMIRDMRNDGVSFEAIARYLTEQGIPTLSGKGGWRAQNVSRAYNAVGSSD